MTTAPAPAAPTAPPAPTRLWPIMVSLVLALIPIQLDGLVAATAVPTIAGDLGGFDQIAWIATSYLLTMAIGTVVAGRIGDMFGRRNLLLAALVLFAAGSLAAGMADTMSALTVARAVQGLGAGMTFTTLLATVADVAPPGKRAQYQGIFGAVAPFSMIAGPWVGGLITDHLGWRWIFWLNLPVVALAVTGVVLLLHLPRTHTGGRVDVAGLAAISVASTGIVLAATWGGNQYPWLSAHVLLAAAVGLLALAVLVYVERRAEHPVMPLDLFGNRTVLMSFLVMALGPGAVMMGAMNYLPVFLQLVQGRSASNSGLLLLPMLLPMIMVAMLIGRWTGTAGRFRPVLIAGTATVAVAGVLLAAMDTGTGGIVTAAWMVLAGAGMGMLVQTPLVVVQNNAAHGEIGAATGAASFLRTIGGSLGVGALGSLFASRFAGSLADHRVPGSAGLDITQLGPDQMEQLPAAVREVVAQAAAAASSSLFWVVALLGLLGVFAALAVPRAHSRAGEELHPEKVGV